jgi:hypothetical protein
MTEMRAGRKLGRTLYLVAEGDDRMADICIGIVDTPELALLIVASVNGQTPLVDACQRAADQRIADLRQEVERRIQGAERAAARKERERIIQLAIDHEATIMAECEDCQRDRHKHLFADLLGQEAP